MASRVYKAGTIITRTKDLLDAGVLKTKPIWFDIVDTHPPISVTHPSRHNARDSDSSSPEAGQLPTISTTKPNVNDQKNKKAISLFETHIIKETSTKPTKRTGMNTESESTIVKNKEETTGVASSGSVPVKKQVRTVASRKTAHKENTQAAADQLLQFLNTVEQGNEK